MLLIFKFKIMKNKLKKLIIKAISVNFVDVSNYGYTYELLKLWFKNQSNFVFELDTEKPDFLFFNVWGTEHLNPKYNNSIKIAAYSENSLPDLNLNDYALGQAHIMYLDRYFKLLAIIKLQLILDLTLLMN